MELTNQFRVSVPVEEAWALLTDLERVAPCLPGAQLEEVEGEEYRGTVKVKVGPITAQYKGKAWFSEKDDATHRAVLQAEGRDTRGQGNASATVTATATPAAGGTEVSIVTDLSITGKVAQFGRSIMGDVSTKLLGQFAERLEADLHRPAPDDAAPAPDAPNADHNGSSGAGAPPGAVRTIHAAPAEPVDLLGTAGPSVLKRVAPLVAVAVVFVVVVRRRRRRRP
jgi:hypothetical protein